MYISTYFLFYTFQIHAIFLTVGKESFIMNNKLVNYLIHGQLVTCRYEIPTAWFVIIQYETELTHNFERSKWWKKKHYLRKNKGVIEYKTNAYSPKIKFYCFGLGIWSITKKFKVNFVNVKTPDFTINQKPLHQKRQFKINRPLLHFEINKPILSKKMNFKNTFSIEHNNFQIKNLNDFELFKQEYKSN